MSDLLSNRRTADALWFRLLDRFGLPTLFAVALLWNVLAAGRADRDERTVLLGRLTAAIEANTAAMAQLAHDERMHAASVDRALAHLDRGEPREGRP